MRILAITKQKTTGHFGIPIYGNSNIHNPVALLTGLGSLGEAVCRVSAPLSQSRVKKGQLRAKAGK